MKKETTLLLFFFMLLSIGLQAQDKVTKIISQSWNAEDLIWQFQAEDFWEYNQNDQEVLFLHQDIFFSDFTPFTDQRRETKYNSFGNVIEVDELYAGFNWSNELGWEKYHSSYSYDNEQFLIERTTRYTRSEGDYTYGDKSIYERGDNENRRSELLYRSNSNPEEWKLYQRVDNIFTESGCLTDVYSYTYEEDGSESNVTHLSITPNEDCQTLIHLTRRKNANEDSLRFFDKFTFEYNDGGDIILDVYERFNTSSNEFEIKHIQEFEFDDEHRLLRRLYQKININTIDSSLYLNSYTPKGELALYKFYYSNNAAGQNFQLLRVDSFIYHYDDFDKLIQREEYNRYSASSQSYRTYDFDYYCNDQLKWETRKEGRNITRKVYEYKNEIGCELEETASPQIKVYPNPTSRILYIESNLLSTPNATLRLISMSGQEVYYKKMNKLGDQHWLELADVPTGNYIVLVTNDEETVSQMVLFIEP